MTDSPVGDLSDLLRRGLDGDERAYRRFLERACDMIRAQLRWKLRGVGADEVQDILQETLLALHLKRGTWRRELAVEPWIRAIARHKAIDALRRRGSRVMLDIDTVEASLPAPEEAMALSRADLDASLAALPAGQRNVVAALSLEGRSIQETAAHLGMSDGAVRVAFHRALARLRAIVGSPA